MVQIPSKAQVLDWIAAHPTQTNKRDIAKAFGIKGSDRIELKRLLRQLADEGHLEKRRNTYRDPDRLPPVSVLRTTAPDSDGDIFAVPVEWHGEGPEPRVLIVPQDGDPALGAGDRILARLQRVEDEDHDYQARLIRRIGTSPRKVIGVFRKTAEGGRILPIDKGSDTEWLVPAGLTNDAGDGELVEAEQAGPKGRMGLPRARITDRLGDPSAPRAVSLIAIHQHGIPDDFPSDVMAAVDEMVPAGLQDRLDLRDLPLITIDPADAQIQTMMPAVQRPMMIRPIPGGMSFGWRSLMWPITFGLAVLWIAKPANAATQAIFQIGLCQCCLIVCQVTCVRCTKACLGPALRCVL